MTRSKRPGKVFIDWIRTTGTRRPSAHIHYGCATARPFRALACRRSRPARGRRCGRAHLRSGSGVAYASASSATSCRPLKLQQDLPGSSVVAWTFREGSRSSPCVARCGRGHRQLLGRRGCKVACEARATDNAPLSPDSPVPSTTVRRSPRPAAKQFAVPPTRPDENERMVRDHIERFGRLDVLVNKRRSLSRAISRSR